MFKKNEKDMKTKEVNETEETKVEVVNEESQVEAGEEVNQETEDTSAAEEVELTEDEKLTLRVTELEEKILRNAAEFENYKKRTIRQFDDMVKFANEKTISEMLDIIDNFDRALGHKDETTDVESFSKGFELINNQMHTLLEKYNVKPIEAVGKLFDPNFHEALMQVESDEFDEGYITFEMNKGYMIDDKVLRHSKVGVAKAKQVSDTNEEQENITEDK